MIRLLPDALVREIAAGEVVSSPADALKELLENALDAGATRLEVELDGGGVKRLRVSDNGVGLAKDELPLAVGQHHTSKLDSLSQIRTFGFRGEGLYALRHAGTLKLTSRPRAQLGGATLVAKGDSLNLSEHPAPAGTSVELSKLFEDLPARRGVLKEPPEELRKCVQLLHSYVLHHPNLSLRLLTDGEERWVYAGGSFIEAVKVVWGPVTANRLLGLRREGELSLSGLISRPELTRPRRDRLLLAVNGRPVIWEPRWLKRVLAAYRELLRAGHYPVGVLNLVLPFDQVLVTTSPDKRRVRFYDEARVIAFLEESLSECLAAQPLAPRLPDLRSPEGAAPAPRSAFPQLTYLGRYRELYLLAEAADTLWVIDQHAAHERIIFESLEKRYRQEPPVELPQAELLPLSQEEAERYLSVREASAGVGLVLEPFGGGSWRVRSVPAFLAHHPDLVAEVVKGSLGLDSFSEAWRKVLGRLACLPAIKAGFQLMPDDAQVLLNALSQCHTPWACPHGRPTALVLSEAELARKFGRSGPRLKTPAVSTGLRIPVSRGLVPAKEKV